MQGFLITCIYFYLIVSTTQTIHFSKPLLCVTLNCADWSISFKAERSATLCTALPWKQLFVALHLVATSGRGYVNVSCGIGFKNDSFQ